MAHILVVDDELGIRELLSEILNDEGHTVDVADCAAAARRLRASNAYELILLDIWMPDTDGLTLLQEWVDAGALTSAVVMMSGHATIDTAVQATRIGAMGFLEKPITLQKLLKAVEDGLANQAHLREIERLTHERTRQAERALERATAAVRAVESGKLDLVKVQPYQPLEKIASPSPPVYEPPRIAPPTAPVIAAAPVVTLSQTAHGNKAAVQSFDLDQPLRTARDVFERAYFEFHLEQEGGSMTRVSEKTGLERTHLYRKLRQLGIDLGRSRKN